MKNHARFLITLVLGLVFGISATAQASRLQAPAAINPQAIIGTGFTYQGRLTDGGKPANGVYDFRFILFDAAVGGAQVGPIVSKDDVPVTAGLFNVTLDFGAVFDGKALYLEIAVRPGNRSGSYTRLSPRQALTPAPYAQYARTAGTAASATIMSRRFSRSRDRRGDETQTWCARGDADPRGRPVRQRAWGGGPDD